jgi:hypothetical protein
MCVCDVESSTVRRPRLELGCYDKEKAEEMRIIINYYYLFFNCNWVDARWQQ